MKAIDTDFTILLIGFSRPFLIEKRLMEMTEMYEKKLNVVLSIDGPRMDNSKDKSNIRKIEEIVSSRNWPFQIQVNFRNANLGCDIHIPIAITEILENSNKVVVLEDDIKISKNGIQAIVGRLVYQDKAGILNPVLGISGLTRIPLYKRNFWRNSPYFCAWGYGLTRDFWKIHQEIQEAKLELNETLSLLEKSRYWEELDKRRKELWIERFTRGNYDYQIQKTLFLKNIESSAPLFRLIENEGHGAIEASHTRHEIPYYLKAKVKKTNSFNASNSMENSLIINALRFVDAQTWAGEGWLSPRGRTSGIRTYFKEKSEMILGWANNRKSSR